MTESPVRHEEPQFSPDFDIQTVRVEHMSTEPGGFALKTVRSEPRDTGEKPIDWLFGHEEEVKVSHPNRLDVKLGTQALLREGNDLNMIATPAYFYEYKNAQLANNPDIPKPAGTAFALFTTETVGPPKLILQHRGQNNFFYGDIPGASVAGMWNAAWKVVDGERVKIDDVDTDTALTNVYREMAEEIGVSPSELYKIAVRGYCWDKVKPHPEFIHEGVTTLSASEVLQRAQSSAKNEKYVGSHNFAERVFTINGTPDAIETLLTEVHTPLPPTHVATFVGAWYSLMTQEVAAGKISLEQAQQQLDRLARKVQENYQHIDELVAFHYRHNPQDLDNLFREGQPRNPRGYTPAYFPQHQGLPDVASELQRTGLISLPSNH